LHSCLISAEPLCTTEQMANPSAVYDDSANASGCLTILHYMSMFCLEPLSNVIALVQ
jgi:hypothetical protein